MYKYAFSFVNTDIYIYNSIFYCCIFTFIILNTPIIIYNYLCLIYIYTNINL